MPSLLPANDVVIEILEDTRPTAAVYGACKALYRTGYKLALDDFQYQQRWDKFMPFTRLDKFDLQTHSLDEVTPVLNKLRPIPQLKLLAEKVETHEQFMQARKMGFDFFQGYFFCKPEILKSRDIVANYDVIMAIYAELSRSQLNYDNLTEQFAQDVSLTHKLLRFINSGVFNLDQPVNSIEQALIYLGEQRARRFIALISTAHIGKGKPMELVRISVIRARFCELIMKTQNELETETAFLLGLFSLIDAILDHPIEDIINSLPLTLDIQEALIGFKNPLYHLLELVRAYESGSWYLTQKFANVVQTDDPLLANLYTQAVSWSSTVESATESDNT